MELVYSNEKPPKFEAVGNGTWLYSWGAEQRECGDWQCYVVNIGGELTSSAITLAVISAVWGAGVEQKLINDYNAAQLGILSQSYIEAYAEFLSQRKALKEQIAADSLEAGFR